MKPRMILTLVVLTLLVAACGKGGVRETASPSPMAETEMEMEVNGSLEEIKGVRVLRVWGSRRGMGYAQGYLLADDLR